MPKSHEKNQTYGCSLSQSRAGLYFKKQHGFPPPRLIAEVGGNSEYRKTDICLLFTETGSLRRLRQLAGYRGLFSFFTGKRQNLNFDFAGHLVADFAGNHGDAQGLDWFIQLDFSFINLNAEFGKFLGDIGRGD